MPKLIVTTRENEEKVIESRVGFTVMEVIRDAGIDELPALCGGCCSCATCHVYIDPAFSELVGPPGTDESDLLDASGCRNEKSRLSCQITFSAELDGLKVAIAPED